MARARNSLCGGIDWGDLLQHLHKFEFKDTSIKLESIYVPAWACGDLTVSAGGHSDFRATGLSPLTANMRFIG
jgi:hypothetical protein